MVETPQINNIAPGEAKPKMLTGHWFKMKFKFKGVISEKCFLFTGTPREATERAKQHCLVQGYSQHIWTEPVFHDLDLEDAAVRESR